MKLMIRGVLMLTLLVMATGCLKFKQEWTVNPDGSGKMKMTMSISEQMLGMAESDPFADLDPAEMIQQEQQGWVAFTRPVIQTIDGFKTATFTGYFEDVNAVKFGGDEEGGMEDATYAFEEGKLTVTNSPLGQMLKSMTEDPSMNDPQMKAMMAPMIKGLELSEVYHMPGQVSSADGFTVAGNAASARLTDEDLLAENPPRVEGLQDGSLTIEFEPAGWNGGEAAWQAELAAAKVEWEKVKQEAAAGASADTGGM